MYFKYESARRCHRKFQHVFPVEPVSHCQVLERPRKSIFCLTRRRKAVRCFPTILSSSHGTCKFGSRVQSFGDCTINHHLWPPIHCESSAISGVEHFWKIVNLHYQREKERVICRTQSRQQENRLMSSTWNFLFVSGTTTTLWALTVNTSLVCLFMFQHSAMANPLFKMLLNMSGLQVAERSIYVIATSFALQASSCLQICSNISVRSGCKDINMKSLLLIAVCNLVLATYSMDKPLAHGHKWNSTVDSIYSGALFCLVYYLYWHPHDGHWRVVWHQASKILVQKLFAVFRL